MELDSLYGLLKQRVLVLDGAMGTMIQRLNLTEDDFRGRRFESHPVKLSGCNDLLCLTAGNAIKGIHKAYLDAGADIITTNSFNANSVSMSDYGIDKIPGLISEINKTAAGLAREATEEATPRWWGGRALVAGSVGPTNRTASMSPEVDDPSFRNITYDELIDAYSCQIDGLVEGGVDFILFETVFDTLNLKAGLDAANSVMEKRGVKLPVMISATVSDKAGRTLSGQTIRAFVTSVEEYDNVFSLGLNCSFGPADILPYLREMAENSSHFISCHPNAGLPNALGEYDETPERFAYHMGKILGEGIVNIAGGCCGTTPEHIAALSALVADAKPHLPVSLPAALRVSGLEMLEITPRNNFVNVGERCNVAGSRKFLRLIKEKKYDEALSIAAKQVADGAMMIDVNMDDAMLDAKDEMVRFLRFMASDPDISRVPVMVDSSDFEVVEAALKNLQGKSIVNSISLKEGEDKFIEKARKIRRLGAAVIVMAFDEDGQADTFARKTDICKRAYNLLVDKCGFSPDDIIFDVNVMAVATGMEEHSRYGIDFILAVEWIKKNLPGARTSGGISNLSFAFRGKNYLREAMHAVFLYHAIKSGLDMGIVNPSSSVTYEDVDAELRELLEDVILARRKEAADELADFAAKETVEAKSSDNGSVRNLSVPVVDRLSDAIVKGNSYYLETDLEEALAEGISPVKIIEGPLMRGMNHVGDLFGEGKMFLPQVVKTARTMKRAVDFLKPFMKTTDSGENGKAGKVVFATVKGDVHDIGKNIVSIVLSCNNYEVIDLGVMVPAEKIIATVKKENPDLVCLSGLITPSLAEMVNVARAMEKEGFDIPLVVGGATTSKIHTALKIAPEYHGGVVHALDASQNPVIASRLLNPVTRKEYLESLSQEYETIRDGYNRNEIKTVPLELAREKGESLHRHDTKPVKPAEDLGKEIEVDLDIAEIAPFINWKMFFHAWRVSGDYLGSFPYDGCESCTSMWLSGLPENDRKKAEEALRLYDDARRLLLSLKNDGNFDGKGLVVFHKAFSEGDDLWIAGERFPMLRQQKEGSTYCSVADFVARRNGPEDYVGVFAVTAGKYLAEKSERLKNDGDSYGSLLCQSVADRIAEAASEWLHCKVRRELWGYASSEDLDVKEMLRGEYSGIRPAVGYPMIPDQLLNHALSRLVPFERIGVALTENGAMTPSASVCGLYIANPEAEYFMVGEIGEDQLVDYSGRRGIETERMKEILRL